jgi:hypothetical protein
MEKLLLTVGAADVLSVSRTPRRMLPPRLQHRRLHLRRHLLRRRPRPMRPVDQTLQSRRLIPGQPGMKRLPRHTHRSRGLVTVRPSLITANTA